MKGLRQEDVDYGRQGKSGESYVRLGEKLKQCTYIQMRNLRMNSHPLQ